MRGWEYIMGTMTQFQRIVLLENMNVFMEHSYRYAQEKLLDTVINK